MGGDKNFSLYDYSRPIFYRPRERGKPHVYKTPYGFILNAMELYPTGGVRTVTDKKQLDKKAENVHKENWENAVSNNLVNLLYDRIMEYPELQEQLVQTGSRPFKLGWTAGQSGTNRFLDKTLYNVLPLVRTKVVSSLREDPHKVLFYINTVYQTVHVLLNQYGIQVSHLDVRKILIIWAHLRHRNSLEGLEYDRESIHIDGVLTPKSLSRLIREARGPNFPRLKVAVAEMEREYLNEKERVWNRYQNRLLPTAVVQEYERQQEWFHLFTHEINRRRANAEEYLSFRETAMPVVTGPKRVDPFLGDVANTDKYKELIEFYHQVNLAYSNGRLPKDLLDHMRSQEKKWMDRNQPQEPLPAQEDQDGLDQSLPGVVLEVNSPIGPYNLDYSFIPKTVNEETMHNRRFPGVSHALIFRSLINPYLKRKSMIKYNDLYTSLLALNGNNQRGNAVRLENGNVFKYEEGAWIPKGKLQGDFPTAKRAPYTENAFKITDLHLNAISAVYRVATAEAYTLKFATPGDLQLLKNFILKEDSLLPETEWSREGLAEAGRKLGLGVAMVPFKVGDGGIFEGDVSKRWAIERAKDIARDAGIVFNAVLDNELAPPQNVSHEAVLVDTDVYGIVVEDIYRACGTDSSHAYSTDQARKAAPREIVAAVKSGFSAVLSKESGRWYDEDEAVAYAWYHCYKSLHNAKKTLSKTKSHIGLEKFIQINQSTVDSPTGDYKGGKLSKELLFKAFLFVAQSFQKINPDYTLTDNMIQAIFKLVLTHEFVEEHKVKTIFNSDAGMKKNAVLKKEAKIKQYHDFTLIFNDEESQQKYQSIIWIIVNILELSKDEINTKLTRRVEFLATSF